jgi:beta-lactam-binding protein with PASTA domain
MPTIPVPTLQGMTLPQAESAIGKNLVLGDVNGQNAGWIVVNQNPPAGRAVPFCTSITLMMGPPTAKPPVLPTTTVPDILLLPEDSIQRRLDALHLTYGGTTQKESSDSPPGTMFAQSPPAGSQVSYGTTVIRYSAISPTPQPQLQVNLTASANSLLPAEAVMFTATLTPSQEAVEFQFDFGDGTPGVTSNQQQVPHAYQQDGNYSVRVTAIWNHQQVQSQALQIAVHDVIYTVTLKASLQIAQKGQTVEFQATVWPAIPTTTKPEFIFDFGDKSAPEDSASPDAQHTYQDTRTYQATATFVTEDGHKISSDPVEVAIVLPPPPHRPPASPLAYVGIGSGLLAVLGTGGYMWTRRHFTYRVNMVAMLGTGRVGSRVAQGSVVEAGFGFRPMHPPSISNAKFQQPVISKVERLG